MNSYKICTKTVMDSTDPSITFDKNGVSNHFYDFKNFIEPNWPINNGGALELEKQLGEIKRQGKNKEFDCIIGLSGGLDSTYMLHKAVTEFKLRPLVFHVDAGWNSETAVHNINSIVHKLDLDLFTEVINWEEMKNFQLAMFKSGVPHLDIPQDMAFISVLYKFATKHNIKTILNGGNIATESVLMPLEILYWGTDTVHIKDILKKHSDKKFKTYPFMNVFYHKFYLKYFRGIKVFKPLNYLQYNRIQAISELVENYSFKPYPQKHFESRFTKFFEGFWLASRFNYDMRRNQFSSLILSGQMDREEALSILERSPLSDEEIKIEFSYVASKLEIEEAELKHYFAFPLKYYWDYKNRKWLFDLGESILKKVAGTRRGGAL